MSKTKECAICGEPDKRDCGCGPVRPKRVSPAAAALTATLWPASKDPKTEERKS